MAEASAQGITPGEILQFWFPDDPEPVPEEHMEHWEWRMRGGAHDAVVEKYSALTQEAAAGKLDHWAETSEGRMALIVVLDQFSRSVFAGMPEAFSQDPRGVELVKQGLQNGHYDALPNAWQKTVFKLPLEHCECAEHLENLDLASELAAGITEEVPEYLQPFYQLGAKQPGRHRAVIARYGRFPHRNEVLGRVSSAEEAAYIAKGEFPHNRKLGKIDDDL